MMSDVFSYTVTQIVMNEVSNELILQFFFVNCISQSNWEMLVWFKQTYRTGL